MTREVSNTPKGPVPSDPAVTVEIARIVADHWRRAALVWGDTPMPGRIMAHPLCMVLAALNGNSARAEDFGVAPGADAEAIAVAGYRELRADMDAGRWEP